jgi:hypothetical protein
MSFDDLFRKDQPNKILSRAGKRLSFAFWVVSLSVSYLPPLPPHIFFKNIWNQ